MKLLTSPKSNTKFKKSIKSSNFLLYGLSLSPANLSGFNVCPKASKGCKAACLNTAGMGVFSNVQNGRKNKTIRFFKDRKGFLKDLIADIKLAKRQARKKRMKVAFRLNTLSDIVWENIVIKDDNDSSSRGRTIFEIFPKTQFFDYTKISRRFFSGKIPPNYNLTFSRSESNWNECLKVLKGYQPRNNNGRFLKRVRGNVTVVFKGELPKTYQGFKVINGDETDARFLEEQGVIVGLKAKGKAKSDTSGFVVD